MTQNSDSGTMRAAVVLPRTFWGEKEWKNAEQARAYVDDAVAEGAEIVFFPEGYPGPATGPLEQPELDQTPIRGLCQKAAEHEVWVVASDLEPNSKQDETYFLTLKLISPAGEVVERYVRVQPDTPPLNSYLYNGKAHLLPGDEFVVRDTGKMNLGLCICSELWVPEIPRTLMTKGAEVTFAPVHGLHSRTHFDGEKKRETWRAIARARAAENTSYVIVTQNAYLQDDFDIQDNIISGAFVATPEEMLALREEPGILTVDLDMDRLQLLRSRNYDEKLLSPPKSDERDLGIGCRPGQIWERNPELFTELTAPSEYSFNYDYYRTGLDEWLTDYDRIYDGKHQNILEEYGKLTFDR